MKFVPVALVFGATALVGYAILSRRSGNAELPGVVVVQGPPVPGKTITRTVTKTRTLPPAPVAQARTPTVIPAPPSGLIENPLVRASIDVAAPAAPAAAQNVLAGTANAVRQPFGGTPINPTGIPAITNAAGNAIDTVASVINVPVAGIMAGRAANIRGNTPKEQAQIFGNSILSGVQAGISSAVPVIGAGVAALLGAGAATYEGQRAVKAVGRTVQQGYEFQGKAFRGDFSGGGSDEKTRRGGFAVLVAQRLDELEKGKRSTLSPNDVNGFNRAVGYGMTFKSSLFNGKPFAQWVKGLEPGMKVGT